MIVPRPHAILIFVFVLLRCVCAPSDYMCKLKAFVHYSNAYLVCLCINRLDTWICLRVCVHELYVENSVKSKPCNACIASTKNENQTNHCDLCFSSSLSIRTCLFVSRYLYLYQFSLFNANVCYYLYVIRFNGRYYDKHFGVVRTREKK